MPIEHSLIQTVNTLLLSKPQICTLVLFFFGSLIRFDVRNYSLFSVFSARLKFHKEADRDMHCSGKFAKITPANVVY